MQKNTNPNYSFGRVENKSILGSYRKMMKDSLGFLDECAGLGDIVSFRIANRRIYGLHHPDLVKEVLLTKHQDFVKKGVYKRLRPVFRKGLVTATGELWKKQRRIIQPVFTRKNVESFVSAIDEEVITFRDEMRSKAAKGERVEIFHEMLHLSLRIMTSTMFGGDVSDRKGEISEQIHFLNNFMKESAYGILPPMTWLPTRRNRRYKKAMATLDAITMELVEKREKSGNYGSDFLGMLLSSKDPESGKRMSLQQIRDEAVVFFIAGHETTAAGLAWMFYLLDQNPDVLDEVSRIVDDVLPTEDSEISTENLQQFKYLERVFLESMRMYPPNYITYQEADRDATIGGHSIKKGDSVYVSPYLSNKDTRFWSCPETFKPDRFLEEEGDNKFVFFPFGVGPRNCIGSHFALTEAKIILARLAKTLQFRNVDVAKPTPDPLVTLPAKERVMMDVVLRGSDR